MSIILLNPPTRDKSRDGFPSYFNTAHCLVLKISFPSTKALGSAGAALEIFLLRKELPELVEFPSVSRDVPPHFQIHDENHRISSLYLI